jgi:two-component system nitrate/nitrite response regulator NarL
MGYAIHNSKVSKGKMDKKIRVAILDDHQGIIDGYLYRLSSAADIEVVATMLYGQELEPILAQKKVEVLILDVHVPTGPHNPNPYPILHLIPMIVQVYPDIAILIISMHAQRTLIHTVVESGARGYILKDDQASIRDLPNVVRTLAGEGIYLSEHAYQQLRKRYTGELDQPLSGRQLEALSLCAAYPDASTNDIARMMTIAPSTLRNLLSNGYLKLNVRTKAAAVARARQLGLITPNVPQLDF